MHLVISPHLDDAVLSCGAWLAAHPGAVVLTLFAGAPRDPSLLTGWDEQCGFRSAGEAIAARRREDEQALAALNARPRWLDFTDSQYEQSPSADVVAAAVAEALHELRPALVLHPLGLFHSDHRLAHDACAAALRGWSAGAARLYEDVPYRGMPGVLQRRLAELLGEGVEAAPAGCDDMAGSGAEAAAALKALALRAYPSQLRAFGPDGLPDAALPERQWTLRPAPRSSGDAA